MSSRIERFERRKAILKEIQDRPLAPQQEVHEGGHPVDFGEVDNAFVASVARKDDDPLVDLTIQREEVDAILLEVTAAYREGRFSSTLEKCKSDVIHSIVGPFGLGQFVGAYDKRGGNVDTVHNVRNGVWATEAEKTKFDERPEYDKKRADEYHKHEDYKAKNAATSEAVKAGEAHDAYTGEKLKPKAWAQDHVLSAKETNDAAAIYLAELDPVAMANREANLKPTHGSVNSSKKADSPEKFQERLDSQREARRERIAKLESSPELTDKERKELDKLRQLDKVDEQKTKAAQEEAQKDRDREINRTYYLGQKFFENAVKTSAVGGAKMGTQQAFGAVAAEFFVAVVDEIQGWYLTGRKDIDFEKRFGRVKDRVLAQWKGHLSVGFQGAISGFLSNIVTVLVNTITTTSKRMARMIREGIFSAFRAFKTIILRPEGTTCREAFHEASKLVLIGGLVVGGVFLEEYIVKMLQSVGLALIAEIAAAVIVGATVAILTAVVALLLDRLDLFGGEAISRDKHVREILIADAVEVIEKCEQLLPGGTRPNGHGPVPLSSSFPCRQTLRTAP